MVEKCGLQAYSLFGGLSAEQLDLIRPLMGSVSFRSGQVVIREGAPNDSIYFILEGRVSVTKKGTELLELPEGQTFGEMELLDIMPSVATVTALDDLRLAVISNRCLRAMYERDARVFGILMMNLARDLSRRLRRMDELACRELTVPIPTAC